MPLYDCGDPDCMPCKVTFRASSARTENARKNNSEKVKSISVPGEQAKTEHGTRAA